MSNVQKHESFPSQISTTFNLSLLNNVQVIVSWVTWCQSCYNGHSMSSCTHWPCLVMQTTQLAMFYGITTWGTHVRHERATSTSSNPVSLRRIIDLYHALETVRREQWTYQTKSYYSFSIDVKRETRVPRCTGWWVIQRFCSRNKHTIIGQLHNHQSLLMCNFRK